MLEDDAPADHNTDHVETPHVSTFVDNTEGLGTIFPPYRDIINECLLSVFNIDKPKDWQILLIQALVFSDKASNRRVMCIRQTGDGKSLPIQCCATMRRYVSIVVVPLLSIGADQASNIYYASNSDANIYAEHLDSIREAEDVSMMVNYLNTLTHPFLRKISAILYISPNTITHPI